MSLTERVNKSTPRTRWQSLLRAAGNAVDEAVFAVAPRAGSRRLAYRKRYEIAERRAERLEGRDHDRGPQAASHFRSADQESREAESWLTSNLSIDGVMQTELKPLRDRSRLADDNDALYGGAIDKMIMRIFGSGIRPQCRIPEKKGLISEAAAIALSLELEAAWKQWEPEAGADGSDLYEVDELVGRHWLLDGDGLQVLGNDKSAERDIPLVVECVNPARLATPPRLEGENSRVRLGVEVDPKGKPVAYHVRNRAPEDLSADERFERIEASRVQHCYYRKQTGQTRGLPWGHRVLSASKNLLDLEEAEMVGAQSQSCYAGVIESEDPFGEAEAATSGTQNGRQLQDIIPGQWQYVRPGEKVTLTAPTRPGNMFTPFAEHHQRLIGAGMNFPYELLTGNWDGVSYLSGRLGLIALQQLVTWMQWRYIRRCRRPLWRRFVEECVVVGAVSLSARLYRDNRYWFQQCGWIAPGSTWLDPVKEITASLLAVNGNLTTKRRILAAQGDDVDEIFAERAEEKRREKQLGIAPDPMPGTGPAKPGKKPANAGADGQQARRRRKIRSLLVPETAP